jgi:type I restriction enzyme S subunit
MEAEIEQRVFQTYEVYKDSGVDWLGAIPDHWEVRRLKFLIDGKLNYGANESGEGYDESLPRYIRITDFNDITGLSDENKLSLKWEIGKHYLLKDGDILFARSGATVGKAYKFTIKNAVDKTCCYAGYLIRARPDNSKINGNFLYYFVTSGVFSSWKDRILSKSTIENIGADKYSQLQITLPLRKEQELIAEFLDRKTSQIDKAIAIKEKQIELLKERRQILIHKAVTRGLNPKVPMKDSGVEWIGEIPAHWEVIKMKFATEFVYDGTHGSYPRTEVGYRLLSVRNIVENKFIFREDDSMVSFKHFKEISSKLKIRKGDIQLAIVGATLGKAALVEEMPELFVTQRSLATLRAKSKKFSNSFLLHFIRSSSFQQYLWLNAGFSAQPGVYLGTIQDAYVTKCSLDEQIELVTYIENMSSKINEATSSKEKEIEKLKEYKTSLVNGAVTGKIKVC